MRLLQSRPALRWLVPLALLLVLATGGLIAGRATADPKLASKTPQELLVALQQAKVDGLSGTVVQEANLGIPEIPGSSGRSSDFNTLISGSHTLLVWYAGPNKARIALKGTLGESDIITNGSDVWTWSSDDNTATHRTIPADQADHKKDQAREDAPTDMPKTPQEAADRVLKAIGPTTQVTTDSAVEVANRAAYELVLTPKDSDSLIRQVRIAVDSENFVPLRVQIFGTADKPAAQIGFTQVDFSVPDAAQFAFNPPPGVTVKQIAPPTAADKAKTRDKAGKAKEQAEKSRENSDTKVVGEGWSTVLVSKTGDTDQSGQFGAWLQQLPKESGSWGSGRVLRGTAFSVVLTDDGRIAIGAVTAERLFAALEK